MTNAENDALLSAEMRERIEQIAATRPDIHGQRAAALLAVDAGQHYAEAAAANGLTEGQVGYVVRKFREQGLDAFPPTEETPAEPRAGAAGDDAAQLRALVDELNARVAELQQMADEQRDGDAAHSPLRLLTLVRDNVQKLTPEMQLDVLRNFQGMSAEDLLDLDTWKGMAYMMAYSARFQAGQVRDKMSGVINQVVPEPIQPGRLWQLGKSGLDRVTPEFAKQILGTFQGATREDLMDPDTWKGVWTMISYSLQFQAEQLKQRLSNSGSTESE